MNVEPIDHENHSDSHVEGSIHLGFSDIAHLLNEIEDRERGPGSLFDHDACICAQDSRNVVEEATAGEVCHRVERTVFAEPRLDCVVVAAVGREQGVSDCLLGARDEVSDAESANFEESASGKAESVGVKSVAGEADDGVTCGDLSREFESVVDDSNDGADDVDFLVVIDAGHFCGFAADEGTADVAAACRHAVDD